MKAVLIDSVNRVVRDIEIADGDNSLAEMQQIVDGNIECAWYSPDYVHVPAGESCQDTIMANEEGLFNPEIHACFSIRGANQWFAGNGVLVGCNDEGDTVSCRLSAKDLIAYGIRFSELAIVALVRAYDMKAVFESDFFPSPDAG
jgi:hypothetical protein